MSKNTALVLIVLFFVVFIRGVVSVEISNSCEVVEVSPE